MPLKRKRVESVLQSKFGFEEAPNRSDDHRWFVLRLEGVADIFAFFSHGEREIGKVLEGKIARQLRVSRKFFLDMIECKNDSETYNQQVRGETGAT